MNKSVMAPLALSMTLLIVPTQFANAYTIIEFAVADRPTTYDNATYTIRDYRTDQWYEWLKFHDTTKVYSRLPWGVGTAWDEPEVRAQDYEPDFTPPYDNGYFTIINQTLEPRNPVEMCVNYDNNENLTRCEYTAVADEGGYSVLKLQADVDASKIAKRGF